MRYRKFIGPKQFYKDVLKIAVPLMLQQLITSSVNLVDNLMVGQLGDASLGGVAATNRFYMIAFFATFGILAAAGIFIAQYFGAKDEEHMKQSFRFSILSAYLVILPFFALGFLKPEWGIQYFTTDAGIVSEGIRYMTVASFSLLPLGLTLAMTSAMRSTGETKIPLYAGIISVLTNAVFNYVLIFGHFGFPALGVAGAAYATIIARIVELLILLAVMKVKAFAFSTKISELFHVSKLIIKNVSIKAAPLAVNEFFWASGMATLFKFYATRGPEVISGMSIAGTTADLFFTLFGGMAVASTVMISQPLGANDLETGRANGYRMLGFSVFLAMCFAVLMFASSFIVPYFYNVSNEARSISQNVLRIMSLMFWIYMGTAQCYFILRAGGDTKSTFLMDSGFMWFVNIPVVFAIAYLTKYPIYVLYIAGQSTDFIKLSFSYWLVKKEKWVKNLTLQKESAVM
jgi:putative MATE family efflux protein